VSAYPETQSGVREGVAGFLASAALFVSLVGIVYRPARVIPIAIIVALVSARMTERHGTLAGWAVGVGIVSFVLGMAVAVVTKNPLY
jgi:hypothetical protein